LRVEIRYDLMCSTFSKYNFDPPDVDVTLDGQKNCEPNGDIVANWGQRIDQVLIQIAPPGLKDFWVLVIAEKSTQKYY